MPARFHHLVLASIAMLVACGHEKPCGNGILDDEEQCDDGNSIDWDGCTRCLVTEIKVNEVYSYDSYRTAVDLGPNGQFVVVWDGIGSDGPAVYSQVFDTSGLRTGTAKLIADGMDIPQLVPDVSIDRDGNHVVIWNSGLPGGFLPFAGVFTGSIDILAQRFDGTGASRGPRIQVSDVPSEGYGSIPNRVLLGSSGAFSAFWTHMPGDLDGDDIVDDADVVVRRFGDTGYAHDAQTSVSTGENMQIMLDAAGAPDGRSVVLWGEHLEGCGIRAFEAQWFGPDGTPTGDEVVLEEFVICDGCGESIALTAEGNLILVWNGHDASRKGLYAQIHGSDGSVLVEQVSLHESLDASHVHPSVASDAEGGFVVVWSQGVPDGRWDIWGRHFDPSGEPAGSSFQINEHTVGSKLSPEVAMADDGRFVVTWLGNFEYEDMEHDDLETVFVQKFDCEGNPLGMQPW